LQGGTGLTPHPAGQTVQQHLQREGGARSVDRGGEDDPVCLVEGRLDVVAGGNASQFDELSLGTRFAGAEENRLGCYGGLTAACWGRNDRKNAHDESSSQLTFAY
jgi:hypothetical protein